MQAQMDYCWKSAILALCLVFLVGCASTPKVPAGLDLALTEGETDPDKILEMAARKQAAGESQGALVLYGEAAKIRADSNIWIQIGLLQSGLDRPNQALSAYEQALVMDPSAAAAYEGAGLIYLDAQAPAEAKSMLSEAVALDESLWRSHNALGVIADLEKNHDEAIAHYLQASKIHPESPMVLNNLGYSRYLAGHLDLAELNFLDALSLDRNYEIAWKNLALVYARTKRYDEAVEVLKLSSDKTVAYNDVGYIALLNGDYEMAERLFNEAIRLSPRYFETAYRNREMARNRIRADNNDTQGD